jgi:hypothetical protein
MRPGAKWALQLILLQQWRASWQTARHQSRQSRPAPRLHLPPRPTPVATVAPQQWLHLWLASVWASPL